MLPIAPSTCYAARRPPPSDRTLRDEYLKAEIRRVYDDKFKVYIESRHSQLVRNFSPEAPP